jgi:ABC-type transporter MlaC component
VITVKPETFEYLVATTWDREISKLKDQTTFATAHPLLQNKHRKWIRALLKTDFDLHRAAGLVLTDVAQFYKDASPEFKERFGRMIAWMKEELKK